MELPRWILSVLCIGAGTLIGLTNLAYAWRWFFHRRSGSTIPLLGGLLAAFGITLLPRSQIWWGWWIPLVLDLGCAPILFYSLLFQLRRWAVRFPETERGKRRQ